MALKLRLARGGAKKRPYYSIVVADSRNPRDGRFIEKVGTYNPLLAKDSEDRVKMNMERIEYWMGVGAKPTDRVARFLENMGKMDKTERANLEKGKPHTKAVERAEAKVQAAADAKAAAEEAANAPAEEAPAEEVAAEAPAEEPKAE